MQTDSTLRAALGKLLRQGEAAADGQMKKDFVASKAAPTEQRCRSCGCVGGKCPHCAAPCCAGGTCDCADGACPHCGAKCAAQAGEDEGEMAGLLEQGAAEG